jgi:hypothetical protein
VGSAMKQARVSLVLVRRKWDCPFPRRPKNALATAPISVIMS